MASMIILMLAIFTVFLGAHQVVCVQDANEVIVSSNLEFSNDLYSSIAKKEGISKNICISPFSIQVCLSLAYLGANGPTAKEISTGLRLAEDPELVKKGFENLLKALAGTENVTINVANKIYVNNDYKVKDEFSKLAVKYFNSEIENIDVHKPGSKDIINKWIEVKTKKVISELLSEDLNSGSRVVLLNVIYFKGVWKERFTLLETKQNFYMNEKETIKVEMMRIRNKFLHSECKELESKILELPYVDGTTSIFIILPNDKNGLSKLEENLRKNKLKTIFEKHIKSNNRREVLVSLPKFKIEEYVYLEKFLRELGMNTMFGNIADFSNMISEKVSVNKVEHKAVIEVNENGTVAAAATSFVSGKRSGIKPPRDLFSVDHPFIYLIRNTKTGIVLFMGRCVNPNKQS